MAMISWSNDTHFSIDNTKFRIVNWFESEHQSTLQEFMVFKHAWMIERYEKLFQRLQPKQIFELGVQRGGSSVFFHRLAAAQKLVAIELATDRVQAVDDYIVTCGFEDSLKLFYGVNQADVEKLRRILAAEFEGRALDLVIDDASHFLDETRQSFNALFPFLREGGAYVVEDWPWAHAKISMPDDAPGLSPEKEPLTKLLFELVIACPSSPDYIREVVIDENSVTVWRGAGEIEPEGFNIAACALARGRALISSAM